MAGRFDNGIDGTALSEKQRLPEPRFEKQDITDPQEESTRKTLATALAEQALVLAAARQQFVSPVPLQLSPPPQPSSPGLRYTGPSLTVSPTRPPAAKPLSIHYSEGCCLRVSCPCVCGRLCVDFITATNLL